MRAGPRCTQLTFDILQLTLDNTCYDEVSLPGAFDIPCIASIVGSPLSDIEGQLSALKAGKLAWLQRALQGPVPASSSSSSSSTSTSSSQEAVVERMAAATPKETEPKAKARQKAHRVWSRLLYFSVITAHLSQATPELGRKAKASAPTEDAATPLGAVEAEAGPKKRRMPAKSKAITESVWKQNAAQSSKAILTQGYTYHGKLRFAKATTRPRYVRGWLDCFR